MQFMNITSGSFEVWINHFDSKFTPEEIERFPAIVDVYCYQCLDDENLATAGYVTSVTQTVANNLGAGANWWKAGEFTWSSGPSRAKWTTCSADCFVNAGQADLASDPISTRSQMSLESQSWKEYHLKNVIEYNRSVLSSRSRMMSLPPHPKG